MLVGEAVAGSMPASGPPMPVEDWQAASASAIRPAEAKLAARSRPGFEGAVGINRLIRISFRPR